MPHAEWKEYTKQTPAKALSRRGSAVARMYAATMRKLSFSSRSSKADVNAEDSEDNFDDSCLNHAFVSDAPPVRRR